MSQEVIYTSAPQGLRPGSFGFCTVAATPGMASSLAERLESLSGYRHLFPPGDPQAALNPIVYSHLIVKVGGRRLHILSRIADAGLDYSQRSNKLAHHVALDPSELPLAPPAWVAAQPGFLETQWTGTARLLRQGRMPPAAHPSPQVCQRWREATGDPGWAGVLAQHALNGRRPAYLIVPRGFDPLPLLVESQLLLPERKRWEVTFSTYYTQLPAGVDCLWRCVIEGTPEAQTAGSLRGDVVIDLTRTLGAPPAGQFVDAARSGVLPLEVVPDRPATPVQSPAASPRILPAMQPLPPLPSPDDMDYQLGPPPVGPQRASPPVVQPATLPPQRTARRRGRAWKIAAVIAAQILLLVAVGGGGFWAGLITAQNRASVAQHKGAETNELPKVDSATAPIEIATEPERAKTKEPAESKSKEPAESKSKEPAESKTKEPAESKTKEPAESKSREPAESKSKEPAESKSKEPAESKTKEPAESKTKEPVPNPPIPRKSQGALIARLPEQDTKYPSPFRWKASTFSGDERLRLIGTLSWQGRPVELVVTPLPERRGEWRVETKAIDGSVSHVASLFSSMDTLEWKWESAAALHRTMFDEELPGVALASGSPPTQIFVFSRPSPHQAELREASSLIYNVSLPFPPHSPLAVGRLETRDMVGSIPLVKGKVAEADWQQKDETSKEYHRRELHGDFFSYLLVTELDGKTKFKVQGNLTLTDKWSSVVVEKKQISQFTTFREKYNELQRAKQRRETLIASKQTNTLDAAGVAKAIQELEKTLGEIKSHLTIKEMSDEMVFELADRIKASTGPGWLECQHWWICDVDGSQVQMLVADVQRKRK